MIFCSMNLQVDVLKNYFVLKIVFNLLLNSKNFL